MQKLHTEPHPIEVLLLAALVALEAAALVLTALVALLLTVARWRPAAAAPPSPAPAPPAVHPLAVVAAAAGEALAPLTVTELRGRARAAGLPRQLSRTGRRADLLAALVAVEVAACG